MESYDKRVLSVPSVRYISGAVTRIPLRGRGVQRTQDRNQTTEE